MDVITDPPATISASASHESRLGPARNLSSRKLRQACSRCHSQKLRCVREHGKPSCERCLKLRTFCRFDPRSSKAATRALKSPKDRPNESSLLVPMPYSASASVSVVNSELNSE